MHRVVQNIFVYCCYPGATQDLHLAQSNQMKKGSHHWKPFPNQHLVSHQNGGRGGNRTPDTGIFNPLLYRLSYPATAPAAKPK